MSVRVRFAPSPTGQVHIGNIRVAIFNWIFARHESGAFLLRIEDTDLERSTPQAIETLLQALEWLGIDCDEEPLYQSREIERHRKSVAYLQDKGFARRLGADGPVVLHLAEALFDPSFVTEPRETVSLDVSQGDLVATKTALVHTTYSRKSGQSFAEPMNWNALAGLKFHLEDVEVHDGAALMRKAKDDAGETAAEGIDVHEVFERRVGRIEFKRRYVYFDDMVLGRLEKPLDSLRDLVIVRSDGSPVFHLANVCDDITMKITHILRGNDHVDNTCRHLFLYKAFGETPPRYGHFPMIVNQKGKPYSKRDGDAYVGDFREKGILPACLFNFLALCGWSPGDDREIMTREELVEAFDLARVNASPAQMNPEKLEWMNGQYLMRMAGAELLPLVREALRRDGVAEAELDDAWLQRLADLERQREKMPTVPQFVENTRYFFGESIQLQEKAIKKVLLKKDGAGLKVLHEILPVLREIEPWTEDILERVITAFAESGALKMGDVAQPLRVACTGGTVSAGIWETLCLLGKARTLRRIEEALATVDPQA